jgi:hypothetical protein
MCEVLGFCLSIAVVLTPSTSGRAISMKIRSGPSASAHAMASLLLGAFIASYPKFVTRRPRISRESLLSSTIRIFFLILSTHFQYFLTRVLAQNSPL